MPAAAWIPYEVKVTRAPLPTPALFSLGLVGLWLTRRQHGAGANSFKLAAVFWVSHTVQGLTAPIKGA